MRLFLPKRRWPNSRVHSRKLRLAVSRLPQGLVRTALIPSAVALFSLSAWGQAPTGGTVPSTPVMNPGRTAPQRKSLAPTPLPSLAEVPATTTVVTLKGVCKAAEKAQTQECKTVLLRGELDRIVTQLAPSAPRHASPQQIAINYVRVLAAASMAEDRHLDRDPAVAKDLQELQRFPREEVLAKAFYKQVEEQAANPPLTKMQQYYAAHPLQFEEGELWRLSIPKSAATEGRTHMDPAELKAVMDGMHRQAVLGYDFDQIQLQAYKDLHINRVAPSTKLTAARRSNLPPDQAAVFDLQPGEVTEVIDSYTSLVILKLVSKGTASFDSVAPEIRDQLRQSLVEQALQAASKQVTAEFNLKYIGTSTQPVLFTIAGIAPLFSQSTNSPEARKRASSRSHATTTPTPVPTQPQSNP